MKSINCLTIRAADGLSIPYVGYFKASVTLNDSVLCDRAILVIKDNGQSTQGLIGMNILQHIPALKHCFKETLQVKSIKLSD